MKRVFLIVLDSVGIGEMPDAGEYGDEGSNTLKAASKSAQFSMPVMERLGLLHIDGVREWSGKTGNKFEGAVGRLAEKSRGKDTTTGHWEIAGLVSKEPMPTFPEGFPEELLDEFKRRTGRGILCNRPYSGTDAIRDFGEDHMKTGALIVYTSADSVFQVAAHEEVIPIEEQYRICEIARELCTGKYGVGRVIARPFAGEPGNFVRTERRHDFSLVPPKDTMLDELLKRGKDVLAVGKINDIFAGKGIGEFIRTSGNADGIEKTITYMKKDFEGLCFTNLVDYDMLYGHRNDVNGYAAALSYFDKQLSRMLELLREEDILMITADHGCDPSTASTDHSREYIPLVMAGYPLKAGINLGTRDSFSDIGKTILDYFGINGEIEGNSFLKEILKES